jgi:hypothetical protein
VCDFCSHGASATGRRLVDPKYSRSKQSADSLSAIGILAALGAFGGVLNKFPALTTSGGSTGLFVTASAGHQSMEVVILTDWREQFLRPYRMGRLTRCSMRSMNFSRGFAMAPSRIEFWQQFFSPISSTLQSRQQRWVTGNGVNCRSNTTSLCEGSCAVRGWEVNTAGRWFADRF